MTNIEKAEDLRQQAIGLLLNEREQIDERLNLLGYEKTALSLNGKKRGRPPKTQPEAAVEVQQLSADHS
jgi:hypothetical protein